jgi:hypothetical protein
MLRPAVQRTGKCSVGAGRTEPEWNDRRWTTGGFENGFKILAP